jgi:hypothetical protein
MTTRTTTFNRLVYAPLARIIFGLIVCIGIDAGLQLLITKALDHTDFSNLSGGAFGPEGSIPAMLFCFAAAILLQIICHNQYKVIAPYWRNAQRVPVINPTDNTPPVHISTAKA